MKELTSASNEASQDEENEGMSGYGWYDVENDPYINELRVVEQRLPDFIVKKLIDDAGE